LGSLTIIGGTDSRPEEEFLHELKAGPVNGTTRLAVRLKGEAMPVNGLARVLLTAVAVVFLVMAVIVGGRQRGT
jgi:hypothetical protein